MKIRVEHVTKSYEGKKVLEDISFVVESGEMAAITGPSGQGKTTLLRILLGLEKPDSGRVILEEETGEERSGPMEKGSRRKERGIRPAGCVFQEDRLLEHLSAVRNVEEALKGWPAEDPSGKKRTRGEEREIIRSALGELLPEDSLDQPAATLSGGMRRRVCLARACLCPAGWLLLDEPFTGLDEENRDRAAAFLLRRRAGRTLIAATHSLEAIPWDQVISI